MMQKKFWMCCAAAVLAVGAWAEASGDRPDARHAWAVHDVNRPDPVAVKTEEGQPPSDAIRLFDGTAESIAQHWCGSDGKPSRWQTKDGLFVCVPGSGPAVTKEKFADCQLHVEWLSPVGDTGGLGNSGVILMGAYEIQILNSYGIVPSKSPWKAANYADGQAGALYGQNPPLVNPARPAGVWQSFDIVFHPQRWEGDTLIDKGSVTVFFNGVLVQDNWPLEDGGTTWCRRTTFKRMGPTGPLILQDHGNPVPFRNVWIRKIPSRFDNTVCGGPGVKPADVVALRDKLAAETLAAAEAATERAEKAVQYWSSVGYKDDPAVRAKAVAAMDAFAAEIKGWDHAACVRGRNRLYEMQRFTNMLKNSGFIPANDPVLREISSAIAR